VEWIPCAQFENITLIGEGNGQIKKWNYDVKLKLGIVWKTFNRLIIDKGKKKKKSQIS